MNILVFGASGKTGHELVRADVPGFMLKQLTDRTLLFKPVRVMY